MYMAEKLRAVLPGLTVPLSEAYRGSLRIAEATTTPCSGAGVLPTAVALTTWMKRRTKTKVTQTLDKVTV